MRQLVLIKPVGIAMALASVLSMRAGPPADYRGKPFDDAAYRAGQRAEADRPALPFRAFTEGRIVWNGTSATNGAGWVIGGTEDGELCQYTVEVRSSGTYQIIAAYGNIAGMKPLKFWVDGKPAAACACPVTTGNMHHWTRQEIGQITFPEAGVHLLTLHYERGYNLAYFDFEKVK